MTEIMDALRRLEDAVAQASPSDGAWRWSARQELSRLRELLTEVPIAVGSHLEARVRATGSERRALIERIATIGPAVISSTDTDDVVADVRRLVGDVLHHVQRVNDLTWDSVELELGGSE